MSQCFNLSLLGNKTRSYEPGKTYVIKQTEEENENSVRVSFPRKEDKIYNFCLSKNDRDCVYENNKTRKKFFSFDPSRTLKPSNTDFGFESPKTNRRKKSCSLAMEVDGIVVSGAENFLVLPDCYSSSDINLFFRKRYTRRNGVHINDPDTFKKLLVLYMAVKTNETHIF